MSGKILFIFSENLLLCLMAIRNANLAENWHQVNIKGMQFDSGSFFLK